MPHPVLALDADVLVPILACDFPAASGRHDRPDDRAWRTHNRIHDSNRTLGLVVARWLWMQMGATIGRVDVVVEVR